MRLALGVQQVIEAIMGSSKTGGMVSLHTFSTAPHSSLY